MCVRVQESLGAEPQAEQIGAGGASLASTSHPTSTSISIAASGTLTAVTTVNGGGVNGKLVQVDAVDVGDSPTQPVPVPADGQQVDRALQDIGSDLPAAPASAPHVHPPPASSSADYDFSAPFVPLEEGVHVRPRWDVHPALSHIRLKEEDGDSATEAGRGEEMFGRGDGPASEQTDSALQVGEIAPGGLSEPSAATEMHGETTVVPQPQEGTVGTEDTESADSRGRMRGTGETQQAVSSSSALPELTAEPKAAAGDVREGQQSECPLSRAGEAASGPYTAPTHGHPSDSHIQVGQNISGVMDTHTSPSCHGHASVCLPWTKT